MIVREYRSDEYHSVGKLCLKIWKNSELYNRYKVTPKVLEYLKRIPLDTNKCGFVAFDEDIPVGVILGNISEFWFGPELVSSDVLFWVDEDHRDLTTATSLVRAFEKWSIEKGAVKINIGTSSGIKTEKTAKLFKHFGYDHMGYMFCKRV